MLLQCIVWVNFLTGWKCCQKILLALKQSFIFLKEIPSSPFRVKVEPSHDASKVKAEGPGLSKTGENLGLLAGVA